MKNVIIKNILIGFVLLSLTGWVFAQQRTAKITTVVGTVKVQQGLSRSWVKARVGMTLRQMDKVRTELGASCRIDLGGGTYLKVDENTFASLKSLSSKNGKEDTDVKVWSGSLFAKVDKLKKKNSTFQLSTPTIVAGVRGTRLGARVNSGLGMISSFPENKPGSIAVFVPGKKGKSIELDPGKAIVGKEDGSLSKPREIRHSEEAAIEQTIEEEKEMSNSEPPELKVLAPKSKTIQGANLDIKLKASPDSEVIIQIEGVEELRQIMESDTLDFRYDVSNYMGGNVRVDISASDKFGRKSEYSGTFNITKPPLRFDVVSPSRGIQLKGDSVYLKMKTAPEVSVTAVLGGQEILNQTTGNNGLIDVAVSVKEIKEAAVQAGNLKTELVLTAERDGKILTRTFPVEFVLPKFEAELTQPGGDLEMTQPLVKVEGKTLPEASVVVMVNGEVKAEMTADGSGVFAAELDFSDYLNKKPAQMEVVITQPGGSKKETFKRLVSYQIDPHLKTVRIDGWEKGQKFVTSDKITLQGQFMPPMAVLTVNGDEVSHSEGMFSHSLSLSEGEQTIGLKLSLGEKSIEREISFYVDTEAPVVESIEVIDEKAQEYGAEANQILGNWFTVSVACSPDTAAVQAGPARAYKVKPGLFEVIWQVKTPGQPIRIPLTLVDEAGNETSSEVPELQTFSEPDISFISFQDGVVKLSVTKEAFLTVTIDGDTWVDNEEMTTALAMIDLSDYKGEEEFTMIAEIADSFGRTKEISRTIVYDYTKPELLSSDFTTAKDYYTVVMSWSEPCMVSYFPNGAGSDEKMKKSDNMGNVTFKIYYDELDVTDTPDGKAKVTKALNDTFTRYVQAEDLSGNQSVWYGSTENAVFIDQDKIPRPPQR